MPDGKGKTVRLRRGASLSDFAEKIGADPAALVQALFNLGEMVTATASVSEDTLQLLGSEINYNVEVVSPEDEDRELLESFDLQFGEDEGGEEALENRPPVVSVMGHVDHGKTRLLDAIRKTNEGAREEGGITQGIGAYQTTVDVDGERTITFLDTPGHEAFTAMRARGAKSTDLAILVVAADDGVMPQTVEAINHAKAANVPMIVAINKIDKPAADPLRVKNELLTHEVVAEDFGGDVQMVGVSSVTGQGIDELLDAVLLQAEVLELKAPIDVPARGSIVESSLEKGRGPVATVLVRAGTLRQGDVILTGPHFGRVRAMFDEAGRPVKEAGPSIPVAVLGLSGVPDAGDDVVVVADERKARELALLRPDAYLINAGRAALIDRDALLALLREGRIAGAGFDVFHAEPLSPDDERAYLVGQRVQLTRRLAEVLADEGLRRTTLTQAFKWLDRHDWRAIAARFNAMIRGLQKAERRKGLA